MDESKKDLLGKIVLSEEGILVGKISDLFFDQNSKKTLSIKVKPEFLNKTKHSKLTSDEFSYPSTSFTLVKDVVILEQD